MLTTRELDVLGLLAQGCSYAGIGARLGISAHTVASHIKNAYRKLEVHCAAAAVMRAVELQLLGPGRIDRRDCLPGVTFG
jgi:ATP/maltotriose-dependent transcriptional regulator MalT